MIATLSEDPAIHAFAIHAGLQRGAEPVELGLALRRATMARVQDTLGPREPLPAFFCGHPPEGGPADRNDEPHLAFLFDPARARLLVLAPHLAEHLPPTAAERRHLRLLEEALAGLRELRAGRAGLLALRPSTVEPATDPLLAPARTWQSTSLYTVTRHLKRENAAAALAKDLRTECRRHGLPAPEVTVEHARGTPGLGLSGRARLDFGVAVPGPILLGKTRHLGGGAFEGQRG